MDKEKCPRCGSTDLIICNDEGYECEECGAWFDTDDDGDLIFVYDSHPVSIY